jgi:hypothetical protein
VDYLAAVAEDGNALAGLALGDGDSVGARRGVCRQLGQPETVNAPSQPAAENLVQVFRARDDCQGALLIGFLKDHGIAATLRLPPSVPPFDWYEFFARNNSIDGIFVFERDAERARELIREFLVAKTDEPALEQMAAQKPHPDRQQIGELRAALREERRTFRFLGWLAVAFVLAAGLFLSLPFSPLRWVGLVIIGWMVGSWLYEKS